VSDLIQLMGWTGLDSALLVACVTVLLILPIRMGTGQTQCVRPWRRDWAGGLNLDSWRFPTRESYLNLWLPEQGLVSSFFSTIAFALLLSFSFGSFVIFFSSRLSVLFKTLAGCSSFPFAGPRPELAPTVRR
jgi:hypothetical protein